MRRVLGNRIALGVAAVALAVGGPWLARELRSLPGAGALAARAHQRVVTLEVGGMHCPACEQQVRAGLGAVPGVSTVEVRLAQHRAYVVCARGVPDTALVGAVGRAGPGFLGAVVAR